MESKHKGVFVRALIVSGHDKARDARMAAFHWVQRKKEIKYIFVYGGVAGVEKPPKLPSKKFDELLSDAPKAPLFSLQWEELSLVFPNAQVVAVSSKHDLVGQFLATYAKCSMVIGLAHQTYKGVNRVDKVQQDEDVLAGLLKVKMPKRAKALTCSDGFAGMLGVLQAMHMGGKVVDYYDTVMTGSFSQYSTVEDAAAATAAYESFFSIVYAEAGELQNKVARLDMMMALALIMDNCTCDTPSLKRLPVWSPFGKSSGKFRTVFATVDNDLYEHQIVDGESVAQALSSVTTMCPTNTLKRMQNAYTQTGVTRVGIELLFKESWRAGPTPPPAKDEGVYDGSTYFLPSRLALGYARPTGGTHFFKTEFFMWNGKGRALEVSGEIVL